MLLTTTLLFALQASPAATTPAAATTSQGALDPARLVRVLPGAEGLGAADLVARDLDVVYRDPESGAVELIARDADLARLASLGLAWEVVHEDLVAHYAARLDPNPGRSGPPSQGAWLSPPFAQGSMGGYYTFVELAGVLDQIAAAYPNIVTPRFSLGASLEGRPLMALKLSDNPLVDENEPEVRFDALHHAREPQSMQTLLWTLLSLVENYGSDPLATWIVDHREIWFVPCVNPDGYIYNQTIAPGGGGLWRKNRRNNGDGTFGVDLNRNYAFQWGFDNSGSSPNTGSETYRGPSAASEPEIQVMQAFIAARAFATALSCHTYSNVWLAAWGYTATLPPASAAFDELGALATAVNGYPYGPASTLLYPANGTTLDHDYGTRGTLCWTPEIGSQSDGFWPPTARIIPLAEENELGLVSTALGAGAFVHVLETNLTEIGDGDGNYEPGESVEVRYIVRNSGRDATAGAVTLGLTSASPDIVVTSGAASLGSLAPYTSANNNGAPLRFTIAPTASAGALVAFTTSVTWEGYTESLDTTVILGQPRPFVRDDVELDLGWLAGLPGDTASTGLWAFGDPVGTSSSGQPANPEDDATPGTGRNCFATGNGSTSAGGDDVDDGFTTLVSPRIDLSGVGAARISYERWFADLTTADDAFEVSISNDDGQSWVELERVTQTANAWTTRSFVVNDFLAPSDAVRLRFVASDDPNNSIVEAAVDELRVEIFDAAPRFNAYGRPAIGESVALHVSGTPGAAYSVYWSPGTANISLPLFTGTILIDPTLLNVAATGSIAAGGLARRLVGIPNDPGLVGTTLYFQGLVVSSGLFLTNRDELTFE